jgi:2-polyprenyl-3-methyl-5-hydroxy-6-metoxy-1,4-benzoquinol methylase
LPIATPERRRAEQAFHRLHLYPELTELESRLSELVEYYGWELGHKAAACRRWFYRDDPKYPRFLAQLGITHMQFTILHSYALVNRLDPARPDLFHVYDEVVTRLEALGGPQAVSVLDFGCGTGQIGLAFRQEGYRVVLNEIEPDLLDFARFIHDNRDLVAEVWQSPDPRSAYDTRADDDPFGLVVEWSAFEHTPGLTSTLDTITSGLVAGGMLVTTSLAREWTPALREHYRRDAGSAEISDELFGQELVDYVEEHFEVVDCPGSLAKILIKRPS